MVLWRPIRPSRTNTPKDVLFIIGDLNAEVGSQEIPGVTGKSGLGVQNEAGQSLTEFCHENAVLGCNLKNDRMISICLQGKPFNITVIQIYALTSNAEEAEFEQFYEGLQDLLELLLLLSCFSRVWLCVTPQTAAHQAPPSLGFSRQEHWNGLPFPSPMHESEKWKWSRSVVSDS